MVLALLVLFMLGAMSQEEPPSPFAAWYLGDLDDGESKDLLSNFTTFSSTRFQDLVDDFELAYVALPNHTGGALPTGKAVLRIKEEQPGEVAPLRGEVVLHEGDYVSESSRRFVFQGVLLRSQGRVAGLMQPLGRDWLTNVNVELSKNMSARALLEQLVRLPSNSSQACVFVVSFGVQALSEYGLPEWRRPEQHARGKAAPFIALHNGVIFSPTCGHRLAFQGRSILFAQEAYAARVYAVVLLVLQVFASFALIRQLRLTDSALITSRLSGLTVLLSVFFSIYLITLNAVCAAVQHDAALPLILLMAVQIFSLLFLEVRFCFVVWRESGLFVVLSEHRWQLWVAALFLFILLGVFPSLWQAALFPLYAIWVPQIVLNLLRHWSGVLDHAYVISASAVRLAPLVYFNFAPNFLNLRPRPTLALSITLWLLLQVVFLFLQDQFGGRWFLPSTMSPPAYNYKPPLDPLDDDDQCVVCMSAISSQDISEGNYMVPPCAHRFHELCLQQWMNEKLECPTCRTPLPH